MTTNVLGYATHSPTDGLAPFRFERRELRADDVAIDSDVREMVINRIIDNASVAIAAINRTPPRAEIRNPARCARSPLRA